MNAPYQYDVSLPAGYEDNRQQNYPVIFTLHGKGSDERNMLPLVQPLVGDFIIIGIRGDLPIGMGYQYYELKSLGNPIREQFDRAITGLRQFIDATSGAYRIDKSRRYLLGFSQGAILSLTLALTMGDALKGIVALNGYIPGFVKTEYPHGNVEKVSVLITHGEYDSVFPIPIGRETSAYMQELAPRTVFATYPSDHGVSPQNQRDLVAWLREDAL